MTNALAVPSEPDSMCRKLSDADDNLQSGDNSLQYTHLISTLQADIR